MHTPVRARFLPVVVVLGLALAACAPTQAQPSGSQVAQPSSNLTGGTVKIGMAGFPDSLNPGNGLLSESYTLYELVFDTPIALAPDGSYVPELATDWSVADDGVTWTLTLRDDVKFHDGTPMTSADVKFTLELYRDTDAFPYLPSYPDVFSKIEAPDPTHVVLHADSPIGNFESRMAFIYVLPKHIWEKVKDPVAFENKEMIGTGPFKFVKSVQDESIELAANKDYWKGAPYVDNVTFQTIPNGDARVAALANGDIDLITDTPTTAVPTIRNNSDLQLVVADPVSGDLRDIIFNQILPENCPPKDGECTGHPALKDKTVRKALATAIDKNQIITVILFRLGEAEAAEDGQDTVVPLPADDETIAGDLHADDLQAAAIAAPPDADAPDATVIHPRPEPLEPRPAPRPRPRRRRGRAGLRVALAVVLLALVAGGLYLASRQVYFIGTNDGGLVTVYRGIPYELPFGINLYEQDYASAMPARAIPAARRDRVLDHQWRSRNDAVDLVRALERGQLDAGASN